MKFEVGDKVRLISDEYRITGIYGTSFIKYLSDNEIDRVLEYRKNQICCIMRIIGDSNEFISISHNLNPDIEKYDIYPIIVHVDDIERIEE